ncbi:Phospholipid-transporting ATPase ABCA1 [Geodia barretti]|uniref:Phospholipid-transporting ATPase ABCA1 n=1 Tax=Geodia barretti TaxID=519541 RepID=A0AA35W7Q9_GEOBA|nr:Phospholipid-transporting ATPase ABCA1 [Geodia barretti]
MEEVFMKVGTGSTQLTTSLMLSQEPSAKAAAPASASDQGVGGEKAWGVASSLILAENDVVYETEGKSGVIGNTPLISAPVVRHTGPILWLQQFLAMFLKRFYNSLRFYVAVITQLILPLVFMLFALILIKIPNSALQDQPSRLLTLRHSALSHNVTTFWAQFGDPPPLFNFTNVTAGEILASNLFDYTSRVQSIKDGVSNLNFSEASDCCDYSYQLLDKFCSSLSSSDFKQSCKGNYNYKQCPECLGCCSTLHKTYALACQGGGPYDAYIGNYCPSPPLLSVSDAYNGSLSGPLDSDNTFVAEYLIGIADKLEPSVFFQDVQAGFVVSYQEPPLSFCRLADGNQTLTFSTLLSALYNRSAFTFNQSCDDYLTLCYENITSGSFGCDCALECVESVVPDIGNVTSLPGDYYSRLPSDTQYVIQEPVCGKLQAGVAKVYPDQEDTLTVTIWYNNQPYHMVASSLNAFHNVFLKQVMGEEWSITAYNHPLPRTEQAKEDQTSFSAFYGLAVSVLGCFGFAFLISSFVVFPVQERECKAKHLQFVSGVNAVIYWLGNYAWDLINALVIVILTFLLMAAFQTSGYQGQGLGAVFLLMVYTCWAGIPLAYCVSFLFKSHLVAYGVFFLLFFFPPLAFQLAVLLVSDSHTQDVLHYLFLLHPGYGLQIGFANIYISQTFKSLCDKPGNPSPSICEGLYVEDLFQFDRPGIGSTLMYSAIEGVLLLFLVVAIEYSFFVPLVKQLLIYYMETNNNKGGYSLLQEDAQLLEDDDVANERREVLSGDDRHSDNVVVIKNLSKVYWPQLSGCSVVPSKRAVNSVCLAIPRGEFFGFVGVNGAGKTSTFGMLTGDITPSSGTAFVSGCDIRTDMKSVQQQIGYCPQFDALIERMTGRELLTMFARLRGIPESRIRDVVTSTINKLDLAKYGNRQCGKYSGGNKRKLSTAIALIGDPPILFLDEPTTGMDPGTRRYLWDVLTGVTREGRSIILTTHSMEECEALCTRLTIMVNGEFKCLGSIQHLKSKFGSGYTLQAKVNLLLATPKPSSDSPLPPLETADPLVGQQQ